MQDGNTALGALVEVDDKRHQHAADENRNGGENTLAEGQRIPRPVDENGHGQNADGCQCALVAKMALAEEIAHRTTHCEMPGHSREAPDDARDYPVFALQQIKDIFGPGKTQPDASGIYNAVKILVLKLIATHEEPQHQEFSNLLGHCGSKQGSG